MGKLVPFRSHPRAGQSVSGDESRPASKFLRGVRIRIGLPFPTDARPIPDLPSDARPSREAAPAAGAEAVPRAASRRPARARMFVLAALFAAGCLAAVVGDRGFLDVRRARKELAERERQVAERERIVEELRRHVERLRTDPVLLERIAREQLGFVRPDEVVVLFEGEFDHEDSVFSWTESRGAGPSGPFELEGPPGRP